MLSTYRRSRVIATGLFIGCSVILVVGVSGAKLGLFSKPIPQIQLHVTNKTSSVLITNSRQLNNGDVEVTLLNQSNKAIYAYTILTTEYPVRNAVTTFAITAPVAPGATASEKIPKGNLETAAGDAAGTREIVFSALYLEGGTAEGDARESEKLRQTMGGMKEQARVALRVLRDALNSREDDSERLLEAVEARASSLPVKDESAPSSHEFEFGKATVNDRLLREIKKLRQVKASPGFNVKSQLAELLSFYERLAEKL